MKKNTLLLTLALLGAAAAAQTPLPAGSDVPSGAVAYALPATVIEIHVAARLERFTPGPYARYAPKYLGVDAEVDERTTCRLQSVALYTRTEPDAAQMYYTEVKNKNALAHFLQWAGNGMVVALEPAAAAPPVAGQLAQAPVAAFPDRGVEPNWTNERVTLYKPAQANAGVEKLSVLQNQLVEKNPERRAEEAAQFLFHLRKKRLELITGEMENALSNDGLRAALKEIRRLEDEYLSLFLGKTTDDQQSSVFFVTPVATQQRQLYVAFRLSDTQGLLPADNVAGRPVTLELTPLSADTDAPVDTALRSADKTPRIVCRRPEMVQARLNDGQSYLLQSRLPVYQLGPMLTFPLVKN
jgi:hypothetical protein